MVGDDATERHLAGDGRSVDDVPALFLRDHPWQERLNPVENAKQVHPDNPVPVRFRELVHRDERRDAGVVAEHVAAAEFPVDAVGERPHGRPVRDIDVRRDGALALRPDLSGDLVRGAKIDVGDSDVHALAREREGHRPPEPAATPGDDRDFALEVLHGQAPFFRFARPQS